ncbi:choice-of-anchor M domain-containing protein [Streptomyces scopuliridis]|uniref:Choice-of-anchor M domain-containing protein n=1 Tax=Streptomyces scopuliridis TaxID=452529 RepID=A0ACD4ZET5_9ACTN|nr:choice-of-anchor M domain-containing protein [Streptomyces scopuliridis]WSB96790.1 choice-of-anchor M domain-containing protein [Streptomyces scopuliridis]WSC09506.1 choice-of-anchor M domain-containing protein [Streptomyces scopuliridis]
MDPAPNDVVDERIVIDSGHVDAIAPRLVEGNFRTLFRDSRTSNAVWHEPTSVIMHLTSKSKETIPDPAGGLAFIGNPGDVYHSIPQTQNPEVLWAGWNTEAFQAADIQGEFELSLDEVEGPGSLLVFGWSPFGEPLMRFDTRDGLPDTYHVPARTHEHANWAFTEEGVYRMTFTFRARLASGEDVSDSQVFTMAVGDVDPDGVSLPGDGGDVGGQTGGGDGGATDGGASGGVTGGGTDGGSTGGGSTNGGATDGGSADGGTTDGGATDGGASGGVTGGGTDGGSTGGGSTNGGATDGGSADGGTTDGGATDGGASGGATDGGTDGGSTDGGSTGGATTHGGTGGATSPGGGLAETGAGVAMPLGVGGAVLVAAGAGAAVYLRRRVPRTHTPATPAVQDPAGS